MKKGTDYTYTQLHQLARDNHFNLSEVGEEVVVGKYFIILEHDTKDIVVSFVLTGANGRGENQYTCIYSDLEK